MSSSDYSSDDEQDMALLSRRPDTPSAPSSASGGDAVQTASPSISPPPSAHDASAANIDSIASNPPMQLQNHLPPLQGSLPGVASLLRHASASAQTQDDIRDGRDIPPSLGVNSGASFSTGPAPNQPVPIRQIRPTAWSSRVNTSQVPLPFRTTPSPRVERSSVPFGSVQQRQLASVPSLHNLPSMQRQRHLLEDRLLVMNGVMPHPRLPTLIPLGSQNRLNWVHQTQAETNTSPMEGTPLTRLVQEISSSIPSPFLSSEEANNAQSSSSTPQLHNLEEHASANSNFRLPAQIEISQTSRTIDFEAPTDNSSQLHMDMADNMNHDVRPQALENNVTNDAHGRHADVESQAVGVSETAERFRDVPIDVMNAAQELITLRQVLTPLPPIHTMLLPPANGRGSVDAANGEGNEGTMRVSRLPPPLRIVRERSRAHWQEQMRHGFGGIFRPMLRTGIAGIEPEVALRRMEMHGMVGRRLIAVGVQLMEYHIRGHCSMSRRLDWPDVIVIAEENIISRQYVLQQLIRNTRVQWFVRFRVVEGNRFERVNYERLVLGLARDERVIEVRMSGGRLWLYALEFPSFGWCLLGTFCPND